MTEITRVPLLPIAPGSLAKLWLGVFVAALGAVVVAGAVMPPLVQVTTIKPGTGPSPLQDDYAMVKLTGTFDNGTVFQPTEQTMLPLNNNLIPGFTRAIEQMQAGGSYKVHIPASLGFGAKAVGPVPANSNLNFTVQLLDFETTEQYQQQQVMMAQMRRMKEQKHPDGAGAGPHAGRAGPAEDGPGPGGPQ